MSQSWPSTSVSWSDGDGFRHGVLLSSHTVSLEMLTLPWAISSRLQVGWVQVTAERNSTCHFTKSWSLLLTLETMKCYGYVRHYLSHKISIYLCLVITFTCDDIQETVMVSAWFCLPHLCLFCNERLVPAVPVQYCIHFQWFTSLLALVRRKKPQRSTATRSHLTFIKIWNDL